MEQTRSNHRCLLFFCLLHTGLYVHTYVFISLNFKVHNIVFYVSARHVPRLKLNIGFKLINILEYVMVHSRLFDTKQATV
jgi:hypothetical protein